MSLDTRERRAVLMGLLPLPDDVIDIGDRYQITGLPYLALSPDLGPPTFTALVSSGRATLVGVADGRGGAGPTVESPVHTALVTDGRSSVGAP